MTFVAGAAKEAAMSSDPSKPPPLPVKPTMEECCGRGCDPCIFTYWDMAMDRWEQRVEAMGLDPAEVRRSLEDGV